MSFSCEFVERRTHLTIAEGVQDTDRTPPKNGAVIIYLAQEGTGGKRGGGFGRFNRTTQQSNSVMRSAALVGKMPQRNRKTEFTYRLLPSGEDRSNVGGLTGEEGISRIV